MKQNDLSEINCILELLMMLFSSEKDTVHVTFTRNEDGTIDWSEDEAEGLQES